MKMKFIWIIAEMDSPISKTGTHPYGRRRVGAKAVAGTEVLKYVSISAFVFIMIQMYKLN